MHDHRGDYGIDGSFRAISARGQAIGIGAQATALAVWAGISWARGKRPTAALAGASAAGLTAMTASYIYVVLSNLAIHNIPTRAGRRQAPDEAIRVLAPGGRLAIADLWETPSMPSAYANSAGWVCRRNLGWRMWYGGPWFATRAVTALKPG